MNIWRRYPEEDLGWWMEIDKVCWAATKLFGLSWPVCPSWALSRLDYWHLMSYEVPYWPGDSAKDSFKIGSFQKCRSHSIVHPSQSILLPYYTGTCKKKLYSQRWGIPYWLYNFVLHAHVTLSPRSSISWGSRRKSLFIFWSDFCDTGYVGCVIYCLENCSNSRLKL